MTTEQLFFAIAGVMLTFLAAQTTVILLYINAKVDPLSKNIDMLIQYMVSHEGKIGKLQGQIEGKAS